ncbi:MAG: FapA family protein [Desulfuromonadaceae bacterium]|nr:FapA family protein [Desulfuromonadaceae bacterium]
MTDQNQVAQPAATPVIGGIQVKKLGYSLYLKIPDNRLECLCSYVPNEQGSMMTGVELAAFLKQYNVREGIDQNAFDDFAAKAAAGQQQVDVLLAAGIPPVNGADEYIDYCMQSSTSVHSSEKDDSDVDMHIVQTFINVSSGDEIGRIIPAEPGTPGRDITGLAVPTHPGKALNYKIGKNILVKDNGTLLVAAATGRFCQSGGEISVEEEYVVKGDVNFRIGSLNFKGVVEVRGDVLDNFNITASKGLTVSGNIGVSSIVSDGDITFCGIDGQCKGTIKCGGTLRANFIHDVTVECAGDVIVGVEIHNSTIKTLGRIIVDKGAISGGTYIALGGIEAKKLGSASSQHTKLHAGVDFRDVELLENLFESLSEVQEIIKQTQSLSEITDLRKTVAALTNSIMDIRSKANDVANAKINSKAVLYENVQLTLGSVTETIVEQMDGPHSIIENSIEGGLRFLPMTNLNVRASDIEMAFIREQKMSLR